MSKRYYVKSLIPRIFDKEYVESEKKAEAGDLIVVTTSKYSDEYIGEIGVVTKDLHAGKHLSVNLAGRRKGFVGPSSGTTFKTLIPTGRLRILGYVFRFENINDSEVDRIDE